jgi:hypothetical protein
MKPGQEACLRMAEYQYRCRNQDMMWRWLFTWAAWSDNVKFFSDPVIKPAKKSKKRWKHLTNTETLAIIKQLPRWPADHLNTFIFKVLVEEKFKEKNR